MKKIITLLLFLTAACLSKTPTLQSMPDVHFLIDNPKAEFLWSNYYPASSIVGAPNRIVGLGTYFGITAFDTKSGKLAWEKETEYISQIAGYNATIFITAYDRLDAIDALTGSTVWYTKNVKFGNAIGIHVNPSNVFLNAGNGTFVVLDKNGNLVSSHDSGWKSYLEIEKNILYYIDVNGLNASDISTNQNKWITHIEHANSSSALLEKQTVYLDAEKYINFDAVMAVDKLSGKIVWNQEYYGNVISNLCVLNQIIYFLTEEGFLIGLDKNNGEEIMKLNFTKTPFILYRAEEPYVSEYRIAADSENNTIVIAFGDSFQLMAIQIQNR